MECINFVYRSQADLLSIRDKVNAVPKNHVLIQIFSGVAQRQINQLLESEIKALFPDIALIGSSTEGEILGAQISDDQIIISVSLFEHVTVKTLHFSDDDLVTRGNKIREQIAKHKAKVAVIFSTSIDNGKFVNNSELIEEISKGNESVVYCGGQAGIDESLSDTYVFTQDVVLNKGTVIALLEGDNLQSLRFRNDGWIPVGRKMQVTRSLGYRAFTIDNKTIRELYLHYLGVELDLSNLQHPALQFPLMCERDGVLVKVLPTHQYPDGSYDFTNKLIEGETVRFSFCDITQLEAEAFKIRSQFEAHQPEGIYIYSCGGRKKLLRNLVTIDTQGLDVVTNTAGFFTSTEFFTARDMRTHCLVQNMTILGLSESTSNSKPVTVDIIPKRINASNQFSTIRILTKLISQTSKELEESNNKLLEMVKLDNMTGLYNRNHFDHVLKDELKRHHRSKEPLSLILLDIDYFKQFNDVYGHVAGDNCLAEVGKVIKDTLKRPTDIAFRYGGEEMGGLLVNTDAVGAEYIAESIRSGIENAAIPHAASQVSSYVTASVGYLTITFTSNQLPSAKQIIELCDTMLYQAKKHGRNQCVGQVIQL